MTMDIKKFPFVLLCMFLFSSSALSQASSINVCFSPNAGCTDAIIREISSARRSILIQAYSLTSAPIAKALLQAKKRGISVEGVMDKSNETQKYSAITGSFNFTKATKRALFAHETGVTLPNIARQAFPAISIVIPEELSRAEALPCLLTVERGSPPSSWSARAGPEVATRGSTPRYLGDGERVED